LTYKWTAWPTWPRKFCCAPQIWPRTWPRRPVVLRRFVIAAAQVFQDVFKLKQWSWLTRALSEPVRTSSERAALEIDFGFMGVRLDWVDMDKQLPCPRSAPPQKNRQTLLVWRPGRLVGRWGVRPYLTSNSGSPRVFHIEYNTPPAIRPKVTVSEMTGGVLPIMPTRKILVPMNTSTMARAYLRYLKR